MSHLALLKLFIVVIVALIVMKHVQLAPILWRQRARVAPCLYCNQPKLLCFPAQNLVTTQNMQIVVCAKPVMGVA